MRELATFPIGDAAKVVVKIDGGNLEIEAGGGGGSVKFDFTASLPLAEVAKPLYDHVVAGVEAKLRGLGVEAAAVFVEQLWQDGLKKLSGDDVAATPAPTEGQA